MDSSEATLERLAWSGDGSAGSALVLPGGNGGVFQSHLYWSVVALAQAGWEIHLATWSARGVGSYHDDDDEVAHIADRGLDLLSAAPAAVVLGKSRGTLAATEVARAGVPVVWFTPLMDRMDVAGAVQATRAPTLVVGGTADPTWRRPGDRSGLRVIEIEGADHGLLIPGDWRRSLAEQERAVQETVAFAESGGRSG